jgi:hypothetical protein
MGRSGMKHVGKCHICGKEGPLSFEHVPPWAAGNQQPVIVGTFEALRRMGDDLEGSLKGRTQQRGAGAHTLCERCNNKTGEWYVNRLADFCAQGMRILLASRGEPSSASRLRIYPLEVHGGVKFFVSGA